MRRVGHVARMGEMRNSYEVATGKPTGFSILDEVFINPDHAPKTEI
jgi:hypothetical protein